MPLYVGFDCSTQSLTVVVIDPAKREVEFRDSLAFDEPFFTPSDRLMEGGFSPPDASVVHASPRMWASALETMLGRLARNVNVEDLRAISGSAQQHGSVYCGSVPHDLTRQSSPIWMDSSTGRECEEIEAVIGGPAAVARLTGSRAYPRFTGPQIRKFAREEPDAYRRTVRIHLVSSYLASLLIGEHAPIDHADGSGMNLMDIHTRQWSPAALDATAPDLLAKLPPLVPSSAVIGSLAPAWCGRFGLPAVPVLAWSGDNPCSLIGTGLIREGQLAISLGTSDTVFGPMDEPRVSDDGIGHVFASPLGGYMGITVFRNGSLARERIRQQFELSWEGFSDALRQTSAGNGGALMLPWFEPEITPSVSRGGIHTRGLDGAGGAAHVRAIIEAQAIAMRRHSQWMGVTPRVIHATGGAAANQEILQVIADVFDAEVQRFESTDSAALGAALRAYQAHSGESWKRVVHGFVEPATALALQPIPANVATYRRVIPLHATFESHALSRSAAL